MSWETTENGGKQRRRRGGTSKGCDGGDGERGFEMGIAGGT